MSTPEFSLWIFLSSIIAGLLGSLTGLGGGVVIVPLLTILFHVDIHYAIGASLVSVIATSSGAAAAYVREGYSNIRIGMFLEIATTLGALAGAWLTTDVHARHRHHLRTRAPLLRLRLAPSIGNTEPQARPARHAPSHGGTHAPADGPQPYAQRIPAASA